MHDGPAVDQRWRDEVHAIHADWDVEWDRVHERFRIVKVGWFKNQRQKSVIHIVQEDDGSFRPIDQRTITHLRKREFELRNIWTNEENGEKETPEEFKYAELQKRRSRGELEGCLDDAIPTFRRAFSNQRKR